MDNGTMHFPAQVRAVGDADRRATLNDILRGRVPDAAVLDEHAPFFWRALISNSRLDAYYTHMLPSSLRNYAAEAAAGVAFLPGHNHQHLPIGGSLTGELHEEGEEMAVHADFYTLSGLRVGEIATDDLIVGIRGGLTRDVSIGFFGGRLVCDICGQDYWRSRCPHIAGFTYEEEADGVIRQVRATVGIDDAHLAEVSGVYDGATPGAMIDKVYEMARSGALTADDVRHAQTVYRLDAATTERMLALPALQKRHAGIDIKELGQPPKGGKSMELDVGQVRAILTRAGIEDSGDLVADVNALAERLASVQARVEELTPRAADGDQYRSDLVAEALAEGVRAYGEHFAEARYEAMLRNAPLDVIKQMRDDWRTVGDARFPGGRQTAEDDDAQAEPVRMIPDSAFAG